MYSKLIGKPDDQESDILAAERKKLRRTGLRLFANRSLMSNISRGHNYYTIRFGNELPLTDQIEGIIALYKKTDKLHRDKLKANGFILGDNKLPMSDPRVVRFVTEDRTMELHRNVAYSR